MSCRSIVLALGALVLAAPALVAGGSSSSLDGQETLRRFEERAPVAADPYFLEARQAVYLHLHALGIPPDALQAELAQIDRAAAGAIVDVAAIAQLASWVGDIEGQDTARTLLTAWAELQVYGAPQTEDFAPEGFERISAVGIPAGTVLGTSTEGVEPIERARPKIGGTCLTCPSFDFGTFTPVAAYTAHSSATVPGFGDCAWYRFNVTIGNRYEFTTCNAPGSATWETVLELFDPATSCAAFIARNDDCMSGVDQSTLFWDATFTGVVHLRLKGLTSADGGAYTLAYRNLGNVCESCVGPFNTSFPTPTSGCQCVSGTTTSTCTTNYHRVFLTIGESYNLTTCPAECASATASYDTVLRLYDPACLLVAQNDDGCSASGFSTRSTINYTATSTGFHTLAVSGRLFTSGIVAFGTYTACMRRTASCSTCAAGPYRATLTPTAVCGSHSSTVGACQDGWYQFNLTGGVPYEFATCPTVACPTGTATFDTLIQIYDTSCGAILASDNDGCGVPGGGSKLTFTPATTGTYRLLVRGVGSATGSFTLTFREDTGTCTAPTSLTMTPVSGSVGVSNCSRTETFSLSTGTLATPPFTYSWSITPPAGGSASPASGSVGSAAIGGAATFSSTLTREGTHVINVTITNACGSFSRSFNYNLGDAVPPTLTIPVDTTVNCNAVPAPATPVATDNCDPAPVITFVETRVNGACQDRYQLVRTWTARDRSNNQTSRTQTITVVDNSAPTLVGVPANVTVECDAVPAPAPVTATDTCDPAPVVTFVETRVNGSCPGQYQLNRMWTGTDRCGNATTRTQIVTVVDTTPPVITSNLGQIACLWPPNHWYACYDQTAFAPVITDNCSLPVTWTFTSVVSSEASAQPCGDGNTDPDVILAQDGLSFCVQAERCGQSTSTGGRTYTVIATATDACGNVSAPAAIGTILVPHDQRGVFTCSRGTSPRLGG